MIVEAFSISLLRKTKGKGTHQILPIAIVGALIRRFKTSGNSEKQRCMTTWILFCHQTQNTQFEIDTN